jgi:cobalt-precorrin 5A hydrolase
MRVAGLGFRKGVSAESLAAVLALVAPFDAIATLDSKAQEPGFLCLIKTLTQPFHAVSLADLQASETGGAGAARRLYGTGSVAESAALAAAGPGARLVQSKIKGPDGQAVAAIAETT